MSNIVGSKLQSSGMKAATTSAPDIVPKRAASGKTKISPRNSGLKSKIFKNRKSIKTSTESLLAADAVSDMKKDGTSAKSTSGKGISVESAAEKRKTSKSISGRNGAVLYDLPKKKLKTADIASIHAKTKKRTVSNSQEKSSNTNKKFKPMDYNVKAVVGEEMINGERCFLIRWEGFRSCDDTWVKAVNCSCEVEIDRFRERKAKNKNLNGYLPDDSPGELSVVVAEDRPPTTSPFIPLNKSNVNFSTPPPLPSKKNNRKRSLEYISEEILPRGRPLKKSLKKQYMGYFAGNSLSRYQPKKESPSLEVDRQKEKGCPWHLISMKTMRTISKNIQERLDRHDYPQIIIDSRNAPVDADDWGYQRYLCHWSDGIRTWLPGSLCSAIIPRAVCEFGLQALSLQSTFLDKLCS